MANTYSMVAGPSGRVKKLRIDVGGGLFADAVALVDASGVAVGGGAGIAKNPTNSAGTAFAVTASAYAQYNVIGPATGVGNGVMHFLTVNSASGRPVELKNCTITTKTGILPTGTIYFFKSLPAGVFTDRASPTITAADMALIVGRLDVVAGDFKRISAADGYVAALTGSKLQMEVAATTLYAVWIADAAFTPASTSEIAINCNWDQK